MLIYWANYHVNREDIKRVPGKNSKVKLTTGVKSDVLETTYIGDLSNIAQGLIKEGFNKKTTESTENLTMKVINNANEFTSLVLNEASIGRAYQHLINDEIPVAFITAFRGGQDNLKQNIMRNKRLAADIRREGYGYFFMEGGYIENKGTSEEVSVDEDSLFIIGTKSDNGRLKGHVKKWIKEYDQDAALFKPQGSSNIFLLKNTGDMIDLGTFSVGKAADGFSRIRGREFHFESVRMPEKNWISRLAKSKIIS